MTSTSGQGSDQVISGNITVGNNLTRSYYTISGNLTIARNSTFTLVNTVMTFSSSSGNSSFLLVNGNFRLFNSVITMNFGSVYQNSLNISVVGTEANAALLNLNSSSISIKGSLYSYHGHVTAWNSSVSAPSSLYSHISTSFISSKVLFFNSTYYGMTRRSPVDNYTAGTAFLKRVPYSYNGYMGFNWNLQHSSAIVHRVDVSFSYGGYTKGNDSYMLMNISGVNYYKYVFNSTGSFDNITQASFSFSISKNLPRMSSVYENGLFTSFLTMVQYQDNITIYNLSVNFVSNDTVSLMGESSFNYVLNNSTVYAIDSGFQFNYLRDNLYDDVQNPMKNSFVLSNSSTLQAIGLYSLLPKASDLQSPFQVNESSLQLYSLQRVEYMAQEGPVSNVTGVITSSVLNSSVSSYVNGENSAMLLFLDSTGMMESLNASATAQMFPLLRMDVANNLSEYYGNYLLKADNSSVQFSESPNPVSVSNSTLVTLNLSLPELTAHLAHGRIAYDTPFPVNLSVSSLYAPSGNVSTALIIGNSSVKDELAVANFSLGTNDTTWFNLTVNSGRSLNAGDYDIELEINRSGYLYNSNRTIFSSQVPVFRNITLGLVYSYNRTASPEGVVMNISVYNNGTEYSNGTTLEVMFYSFGTEIDAYYSTFNLAPESSVTRNITVSSKDMITNATLVAVTSGKSLPSPSFLLTENLTFKAVKSVNGEYALLTVMESGLPAGVLWSFRVNNTVYSSITEKISMKVPLGNDSIHVLGIPGYHPANRAHTITISGNASIDITYLRNLYSVTFQINGITRDTLWLLALNGSTHKVTGRSYETNLPNGTYSYALSTPDNYSFKASSGTITVQGENVTVNDSAALITHRSLTQSVLDHIIGAWPVIVTLSSIVSYFLYRRESVTFFVCNRCGSIMSSRFQKCSCGEKKS